MSCNIGLHKTVERIVDNKPWFKYKLGQSYVEILNSPKEKINRDNAYRVAQTLANFLNKAIQKGPIQIGKVFYPEQNQNRFFVTIKPTTVQLNKLNENEKILTEAEIEENEKALEDIPTSIDDEQLELNKQEFEEDEPYTSFENFKFKTGQLALFSNSYIKDGKDEFIKQKYFPNSNENTSTAILQKIALSDHPLASVAGNLLQYDPEVSIELIDSESLGDFVDDSGVMQRASAEYSKNKIRIAKNASFKGLGSEPTIIHEIVHAMTHRYINNNPNSEEVKALNDIYKHALTFKNKMPADSYPFTNLDEFIVAVFTNASTIKFLLGQPSISKSEPNFLAEIFRAIMNLFKLDTSNKTLFNDAFIAATNIIIAQDASNKRNQEETFFIADDGTLFSPTSEVNYQFKAIQKITDNIAKVKQWYSQIKDIEQFWTKVQKDLQIPKEQIELLKQQEGSTIEDIISSFAANYSYSVEVNISKTGSKNAIGNLWVEEYPNKKIGDIITLDNEDFIITGKQEENDPDNWGGNTTKTSWVVKQQGTNTDYYSNLIVPGGTNYTENEISTPLIIPSIKGHAAFATGQGIGWFRSDDQAENSKEKVKKVTGWEYLNTNGTIIEGEKGTPTKTRRILEVQSDLFQKGRDKTDLIGVSFSSKEKLIAQTNSGKDYIHKLSSFVHKGDTYRNTTEEKGQYKNDEFISIEEYNNAKKEYVEEKYDEINGKTKTSNQFLQLLNKDNNWVTFFIKSIIQDSVKKGYEKVLFPSGDTASKVEGHITLEGFKKQKEDRIDYLESSIADLQVDTAEDEGGKYYIIYDNISLRTLNGSYLTEDSAQNALDSKIKDTVTEINQLKQELERVEGPEGFGALKPIYNFYENVVSNILKKQYNINQVTDEYGNTWNEVDLSNEKVNTPILLQLEGVKQTEASPETVAKLTQLLQSLNIPVEKMDQLFAQLGVNGLADGVNRLIQIAKGKESVALTEETMHMLTLMAPSEMMDNLMKDIENYRIYKEVYERYKGHPAYQNQDGTPNERMIKLEAVGKLLAEYYIMNAESLNPEEVNIAKTIWGALKDWIKNIFGTRVDSFQDFINKVNSGKYFTESMQTRDDRLLQLAFTKDDSYDMVDRLTSNLTTMSSYEQAKKDFKKDDKSSMNPNVKAMMALEQAISKFTLRDLPEINNLQSFIHLPKKRAFATSKFKLQEASKEIQAIDDADYFKQFKDKALESLEYIRNMDTVSESLVERINLIKKIIKDNVNYDKEGHPTLDPEDRIRMHHEMEMIQSTMHIYQDELKQLAGLFEDLGEGNPVSQMVKDITGKVTSAIIDTDNSLKENLRETLSKFVTPQVENYKKLQNKQLIDYQKQLNDVEQNIARKRSRGDSVERLEKEKLALEEKIKQVQDNIENPPISVNNIMDILENSEGVSNLGKWSLSNLTESGRTNKNQAILAIATILNNATLDSHKDAETSQGVLRSIFNKFKRKQNVAGTAFDDIVDQVVRYKFNEDTLELEEYDDRVLTRDVKQWLFEDDLEVLKYLYSRAETNPADIDDIAEEYKKYIGEDLTDAEKANLVDTFKNKHNELIKNFGKTKYNDAYNQVQKILDDVVLSTGETVREYRRAFTERLTAASDVIDETMNDEVALEIALQDKADALRELQQLESLFDYNTGQDKTGDALLVAETISRWKKAKKNVEVSPGVFENIDEYYTTYAAELKWKQEKDEHETGIADAEADYNANPTQANKDKLTALKNSYSLWRKLNVSMRASDKFYADRAQIIEAIQTIIDSTKINDRAEKAFAMEYDLAWQSLSALTSGSRDENGVIEGSNLMRGSQKIKEAEEKIENLKSTIKSLRKRLTKEDYEDLVNLIDELNEMQESTFTEYWDRLYLSKYNNERLILMSNGNTNPTHAEIVDSLMDTDFFKKNTIDVTDKYSELDDNELPKDVIKYYRLLGEGRMAVRIVKPIYIWRQSLPIGNYAKEDQMSFNLKNYKVNSVFENPEHETMDGKIALDPSKVTTNPLSASRYENKKFSQLKTEQKEFLDEVRKFYYADQMKKFRKDRLGDSLPRISASKTGRKMQLINPRNWRGKKIFSKQALADRFLGNTATKVEKEYIQGDLKNSNKKIFAKYTYGKTTHSTQEKDLFKLLAMYNSETHRVERLKEYIPALNTASKLSADKKISKALNYQINYGLNQTTKAGELGKTVDAISDTARSTKGFLRLGLPWQIGSVLKNTVVGSYAIWSNASKLKQYSEGMFRSAYMKALPFSAMLVAEKFSATPSKKTAILRRLNVVSGYDINDATGNNADVLLKTANGLGYAMGSIRTVSENQLDITMYELYRDGNKIIVNGQAIDIEDMYDYDNGVLTPKPELTSEIENQFTNSIEEMKSYTQGNFASNNVSLLQAYFLGRTILFMRKHIYNPLMRRIGQKRYTSTGHEIEGFYRIMGAILKSSFKNRSYLKSLSHNEKTAVDAFVKDVVMTSLLGVALYYIEKGFKEGDGDDQDDWLSWYAFLIFRKSVAEISFLNPVEKVAMIYHVLTTKGYNKMSGNPIKSMLMYAIGNPAMEAAATTFIPFDYNTLKFQEKITSNDPYYGQFKNNALLYNFLRLVSWKNDYEYSKSSLSAYEWYNPSGFQYTKGNEFEGKAKGGRKKKKKTSSGL